MSPDHDQTEHSFIATQSLRLDKSLALFDPNYSRTYFKDRIEAGCVTVNQKKVTVAKTMVHQGDIIGFRHAPRPSFNLTPTPVAFDVIDIQKDFIVINKPAHLLVHAPSNRSQEITLVNGLLHTFGEMRDLFEHDDRPGIVHRLDENTSGLMLIARNERGKIALMRMFHDRKIHKTYKVVVRGHTPDHGEITFAIGRHPTVRNKMSHQSSHGKPAHSLYQVDTYLEQATLLRVRIITGRTHQIRVHCAAIGHPVIGDELYGIAHKAIKRQALHAYALRFMYDGVEYSYQIPLAADIEHLVQSLALRNE